MQNSLKVVTLVALFLGGTSIAQDRKTATGQNPSAGKMLRVNAEKREQMKTNVEETDERLQEIEALQRSVDQLRRQLEASPQYLDQTNPLRP